MSASANVSLVVIADPPPTFISSPFAESWANVDQAYAGSIATNGTAPYLAAGDILTFAKVSGPSWLGLAPNGGLSGTPSGLNSGTNTFVVSVTDLGGSSNTTSLTIYVNSAPAFIPPTFAKPAATVGLPYAGTIATNAFDPDLVAGDTLTFYKVTGPLWLNVAANGSLSGTPGVTDVGANNCLMLVTDSGGLAGIGSMSLLVSADSPPTFNVNPFAGPPGKVGQIYSATVATNASDPNFGDLLTFAKISGPSWLNIAGNGALSGLPLSTNAGPNSFVVSVTDFDGLSTNATLSINVVAVPIVETIAWSGSNLMLGWSGGVPPYQLLSTTNLIKWQNVGTATAATNLLVPPSNVGTFYRVQGQ